MMCRRIKSIWSRLSNALRLLLVKQEGPNLDSLLRSLLAHRVLTAEQLSMIHGASAKSILDLLYPATKLREPLVMAVRRDASMPPFQQRYLLTNAGCRRAVQSLRVEPAQHRPGNPSQPYRVLYGYSDRSTDRPDLIIVPKQDGSGWEALPLTSGR